MQIINLQEPCYVQAAGEDIQHLPLELAKKMFAWDSACQSLEIFIRHEIPNVKFYAVVAVKDE